MRDYLKKLAGLDSPQRQVPLTANMSSLRKRLKLNESIKRVSVQDDSTLLIHTADNKLDGKCLFKDIGEGKKIFVTYWDIEEEDQLLFYLGTTLWNDNKRGSHNTCAYTTQKNLCVLESHLNLNWIVLESYFDSWVANYMTSIPEFQKHVENMRELIRKLPSEELSTAEKIWLGSHVAEAAAQVWNALSSE